MSSIAIRRTEILFWLLLSVAVIVLNVWRYDGPFISNDGIQYLSVAENIAAGRGIRTSIVHYDQERSHGEIPAPSTTFPPGYPTAVALLSLTGLSLESAGLLVSSLAFLALIPLVCLLASWFELGPMAIRCAVLALVVNYLASIQSSKTESESLFTLFTIGAVMFLLRCAAQVQDTASQLFKLPWSDWVFAGLLIGFAYWVRYAGLFLFATALLLAPVALYLLPRRHAIKPLATVAIASSMVALLFVRNIAYTGSWKGGNTKDVFNPVLGFLKVAIASVYQLFLGQLVLERLGVLEAASALGALAVGVVVLLTFVPRLRTLRPNGRLRVTFIIILSFLAVYVAAFIYLGLFSVISFSARMFYPVFPLLLLLIAWVLSEAWKRTGPSTWPRRAFALGLVTVLSTYCVINFRDILGTRTTGDSSILEYRRIAALFDANTPHGESLRSWFEHHIPRDHAIVASDGQATAYVLRRKVVSLVSSQYSNMEWNESAVWQVMDQFGSDVLILYSKATAEPDPVQRQSPFLTSLLDGDVPPWLTIAAENVHVKVFRHVDASSHSAQNRAHHASQ